jgi:hypothetical protein
MQYDIEFGEVTALDTPIFLNTCIGLGAKPGTSYQYVNSDWTENINVAQMEKPTRAIDFAATYVRDWYNSGAYSTIQKLFTSRGAGMSIPVAKLMLYNVAFTSFSGGCWPHETNVYDTSVPNQYAPRGSFAPDEALPAALTNVWPLGPEASDSFDNAPMEIMQIVGESYRLGMAQMEALGAGAGDFLNPQGLNPTVNSSAAIPVWSEFAGFDDFTKGLYILLFCEYPAVLIGWTDVPPEGWGESRVSMAMQLRLEGATDNLLFVWPVRAGDHIPDWSFNATPIPNTNTWPGGTPFDIADLMQNVMGPASGFWTLDNIVASTSKIMNMWANITL